LIVISGRGRSRNVPRLDRRLWPKITKNRGHLLKRQRHADANVHNGCEYGKEQVGGRLTNDKKLDKSASN